jgi:hypothetical protein
MNPSLFSTPSRYQLLALSVNVTHGSRYYR